MKNLEHINIRDEMPEELQVAREKLIQLLEDGSEGLNTGRVNEFMNDLGLEPRKFLFVKNDKHKQANDTLKSFGLPPLFFEPDTAGQYLPHLDIALIKRVSDGGPEESLTTESLAVHELAHASDGYKEATIKEVHGWLGKKKNTITIPRTGFVVNSTEDNENGLSGSFFEEGFADLLRGKYIKNFANQEEYLSEAKFVSGDDAIDTRGGLDQNVHYGVGKKLFIPAKYLILFYDGSIQLKFGPSAIAAFGLETLCEANPELFQVLIRARTDIDALRQLPREINKISPDLYSQLRRLEYSSKDFLKGLMLAWHSVGKDTRVFNGKKIPS